LAFSKFQAEKLILIIDDAGKLMPGLLARIIGFALEHPALNIVFALTPDDLFIKTRTDHVIDDCYFIEIPPLSESNAVIFALFLPTKSPAKILKPLSPIR